MQKKTLTKEQALQKLRHYCRYQERCHHEVEQKLWDLGVKRSFHDEIISLLVEEGDLNEERFAVHFAGGKFRMLQWGKKKIYYALKEKRVSEYSIKKALNAIETDLYIGAIKELAEKKYNILKEEQYLVRKKKTVDYLLQKGFEAALINEIMQELTSAHNK